MSNLGVRDLDPFIFPLLCMILVVLGDVVVGVLPPFIQLSNFELVFLNLADWRSMFHLLIAPWDFNVHWKMVDFTIGQLITVLFLSISWFNVHSASGNFACPSILHSSCRMFVFYLSDFSAWPVRRRWYRETAWWWYSQPAGTLPEGLVECGTPWLVLDSWNHKARKYDFLKHHPWIPWVSRNIGSVSTHLDRKSMIAKMCQNLQLKVLLVGIASGIDIPGFCHLEQCCKIFLVPPYMVGQKMLCQTLAWYPEYSEVSSIWGVVVTLKDLANLTLGCSGGVNH